jgi:ATP-dependent DNA ligase
LEKVAEVAFDPDVVSGLALRPPYLPMNALLVDEIPTGPEWQYEPKWDGFRCLVFREGDEVELQSKAGQPLTRYFPELVEAFRALKPKQFVLDGEIAIPIGDRLSFDDLLQRIHPADSRVRKLSKETPALFIGFDELLDTKGVPLVERPLSERRATLERFYADYVDGKGTLRLSPATTELEEAKGWYDDVGVSLDGIIAKRLDTVYESGERTGANRKIKSIRTCDCVIGGFRYGTNTQVVGSILLGLYEGGKLHHVGFSSGFNAAEKKRVTELLESRRDGAGFSGRAPGGPSRWSRGRSMEWVPVTPDLVVEVSYDHYTNGRFRHGTRVLRWRPDKAPADCTLDQVVIGGEAQLKLLE